LTKSGNALFGARLEIKTSSPNERQFRTGMLYMSVLIADKSVFRYLWFVFQNSTNVIYFLTIKQSFYYFSFKKVFFKAN